MELICLCNRKYKPTVKERLRRFFKMEPIDYRISVFDQKYKHWVGLCAQCGQPHPEKTIKDMMGPILKGFPQTKSLY